MRIHARNVQPTLFPRTYPTHDLVHRRDTTTATILPEVTPSPETAPAELPFLRPIGRSDRAVPRVAAGVKAITLGGVRPVYSVYFCVDRPGQGGGRA